MPVSDVEAGGSGSVDDQPDIDEEASIFTSIKPLEPATIPRPEENTSSPAKHAEAGRHAEDGRDDWRDGYVY